MSDAFLQSGPIELTEEGVDRLPDTPGVFRLRSSGQRVAYIGWAGANGLRDAVRRFRASMPVAGLSTVEYSAADSGDEARARAEADVRALRPSYNEGFGRYRNAETPIPTSGRSTRRAMHNP